MAEYQEWRSSRKYTPLLAQWFSSVTTAVLTVTGFVNERAIFDPPQNPHPFPDHQKIVANDYVVNPYGRAKFGANQSAGDSGQISEIWLNFFYSFIPIFHELTYRSDLGFSRLMAETTQTRARMCLLGVSLILLLILGVKYLQNPNFGAWIDVFNPNKQNIESFIL